MVAGHLCEIVYIYLMVSYQEIKCPLYGTANLGKAGESEKGVWRYFCKNEPCSKHILSVKRRSYA